MKQFAALFLILCLCPGNLWAQEYPWKMKKDKNGIQVSVRKVEGSEVLEYKGQTVVNAEIARVIAFYEDETRMPGWFHQCVESKLLKVQSPDDKILYFAIDLPWPVNDRDSVYRRVKTTDTGGAVEYVLTEADSALYPAREGRLRMPAIRGVWRFTPLPEGRTEVYYQQHGDAGGHIPAVMINQLAVTIPFQSLSRFREQLLRKKT